MFVRPITSLHVVQLQHSGFFMRHLRLCFVAAVIRRCWWDHWILDFAVCNMAGIIIGELLMVKLNSKGYDWAGFSEIAGVKGKLQRAVLQFTPASWTPYKWHLMHDFRRFAYVLAVVVGAMVIELDAFFLKDLFWVQPTSKLNVYRLIVWWAVAMVGLRDYYAFMSDRSLKRLGSTAWVMLSMMLIEALTVIKFGRHLYKDKPLPPTIAWAWGAVLTAFAGWTVWWFFLRSRTPEELAAPSPTAASAPASSGVGAGTIAGYAHVPALENAAAAAAASEPVAAPSASGATVPGSVPRQISRGGTRGVSRSSAPATPEQAPASAPASAPTSAAKQTAPTPAAQAPAPAPARVEEEAIELSSDSSDSSTSESESEEEARPRRGAAGKRQASASARARKPTPAKAQAKPTPAKGKAGGRKPAAAAYSDESSSSSSSFSSSESESSEEEVLPRPRARGRGTRAASASAATAESGAGSAATRGRRRGGR